MKWRFLLLILLVWPSQYVFAEGTRFFLEGDGVVRLYNPKNGARGELRYRSEDGSYSELALSEINHIFGLKKDGQLGLISLRLIALLDYIQDRFADGTKTIRLDSAYRSPQYNERLREQGGTVARASTHMEGMAADITVPGVKGEYLWEQLRELNCCGVGWYGKNSVHVDTGPARWWTGKTSKVRTDISAHNKQIVLRTEQDIYRSGEIMQLNLVRITEFPFGVKRKFRVVARRSDGRERTLKRFEPAFLNMRSESTGSCVMLQSPEEARRIVWRKPPRVGAIHELPLHIRVDFCQKPHPDMPDQLLSNRFELN